MPAIVRTTPLTSGHSYDASQTRCAPRVLGLLAVALVALGVVLSNDARAREDPGYLNSSAGLRAKPTFAAPTIKTLSSGTAVKVLGMRGRFTRLEVSRGERGWVNSRAVSLGSRAGTRRSARGDDGAGWLRVLTGGVARGRGRSSSQGVTIGVRGLTEKDIRDSVPKLGLVQSLERYAVSGTQARAFAQSSGLRSRRVAHVSDGGIFGLGSGSSSGSGPDSGSTGSGIKSFFDKITSGSNNPGADRAGSADADR